MVVYSKNNDHKAHRICLVFSHQNDNFELILWFKSFSGKEDTDLPIDIDKYDR